MDTSERPIGPDDVEAHYESLWGKAQDKRVFRTQTNAFSILTFTPQQTDEGVFLFATVGASQVMGDRDRSCEFFFGLTTSPKGLPDSLAEIALDGNGTGQVPDSGDTTTLAFELWEGTSARSYLFTDGGDEIVPHLKRDGALVEFIQLVPLFADELEYKKKHGEPALWEHFEENEVPYWDAQRVSAF
ncbi:suppressor of fused domain protein [uncultured Roseobacter sp.]|uniref:suppressor of fused domain protein n=1 Tax=uncultured Roseobacter sp. TaxID=114847 RepID=UPI00260FD8B3|nr:suppressor of fused domain protein [uncultured Roseobacter sp.]